MKHIRLYLFLLSSLAFGIAEAQKDSGYQLLQQLSYPVSYFTVNSTGELFVINPGNQLKKYDASGDSVGVFNDVKKFGKLSYVAAGNPFKVLLYYEGFQTIVMLDKYMNNLGSINLGSKNIFNVKAITNSYDNHIWVFDGGEFKIKKLDDNGNVLSSSVDLRQVFDEDILHPEKIIDNDGLLYLYDPEKGIYIFDYYGSFKNRLPFLHWKNLFVRNKVIYGLDSNNIYIYKPPIPLPDKTTLPASLRDASIIGFSGQKIYVLKNEILRIYRQ